MNQSIKRTISLLDGTVSETKRQRTQGADSWSEHDLEAALAIAPELLGLAGAAPITLHGGGAPSQSPDQMYVDSMSRVHVVEVKKGEARFDAIGQIFAYGDMYRMLPRAAIESAQAYLDETCQPQALLDALRRWAGSRNRDRIAPRVVPRLPNENFPRGLSARHVLVAKSFGDDVKRFAEELSERGTSLELLQANMRCRTDAVEVEVTPVVRARWIEATWSAYGSVWSSPKVRKRMELVGWAEPISRKSFSLALKKNRLVRLLIEIDEDGAWLSTRAPDGYFGRKPPPVGFWEALPKPHDVKRRDLFWYLGDLAQQDVAELAGRIAEGLAAAFASRS